MKSSQYFEVAAKISRIRTLFQKLKDCHGWIERNNDGSEDFTIELEKLYRKAEPIFKELKELGVKEQFAIDLFFVGREAVDHHYPKRPKLPTLLEQQKERFEKELKELHSDTKEVLDEQHGVDE